MRRPANAAPLFFLGDVCQWHTTLQGRAWHGATAAELGANWYRDRYWVWCVFFFLLHLFTSLGAGFWVQKVKCRYTVVLLMRAHHYRENLHTLQQCTSECLSSGSCYAGHRTRTVAQRAHTGTSHEVNGLELGCGIQPDSRPARWGLSSNRGTSIYTRGRRASHNERAIWRRAVVSGLGF